MTCSVSVARRSLVVMLYSLLRVWLTLPYHCIFCLLLFLKSWKTASNVTDIISTTYRYFVIVATFWLHVARITRRNLTRRSAFARVEFVLFPARNLCESIISTKWSQDKNLYGSLNRNCWNIFNTCCCDGQFNISFLGCSYEIHW